jgi:hypothetical protein
MEVFDVALAREYRRKLNEPILIVDARDLNKKFSVLTIKQINMKRTIEGDIV